MSTTPATIHTLSTSLVKAISDRFMSDSEFRTHMLADPHATLSAEGMDVVFDLITRIKGADAAAVEAGLKHGEGQPGC